MSIADNEILKPGLGTSSHAAAPVRFKFRITLEGVMLLIVILLVGFAAWHSGTNLLYLIFSILIAFYLLHGFLMSVNLSRLKSGVIIPETVIAGQAFDVGVTLTNLKKHAPTTAIRISHQVHNLSHCIGAVYFSGVPAQQTRDAFYSVILPRRGEYQLKTAALSTRYPFGFEERIQLRPLNEKVLALPPTYNVAAVASTLPFGFGDQDSNVRGAGTELYGLREYVPGESVRHVHWRTSARANKVMVAEFTRDERRQVMLLLDNRFDPQLLDESINNDFENAIILTASLAKHLINSGFEIGLITSDRTLPVGQGPSHLVSLLRHLATIKLASPAPLNYQNQSLLEIKFHSLSERTDVNGSILTIDSRTWRPPSEEFVQGEKSL